MAYKQIPLMSTSGNTFQYEYGEKEPQSVTVKTNESLSGSYQIAADNNTIWVTNSLNGKVIQLGVDETKESSTDMITTQDDITEDNIQTIQAILVQNSVYKNLSPTGLVVNSTDSFKILSSSNSATAKLIICTKEGQILAWNSGSSFTTVYSSDLNEQFMSLTIVTETAQTTTGPLTDRLYVTDFCNKKIIVFDSNFNRIIEDSSVVSFNGEEWCPLGILNFSGYLFITCSTSDYENGILIKCNYDFTNTTTIISSNNKLKGPYGISKCPAEFNVNDYSNTILVSNITNGYTYKINVNLREKKVLTFKYNRSCDPDKTDCHSQYINLQLLGITGIVNLDKRLYYVSNQYDEEKCNTTFGYIKYS